MTSPAFHFTVVGGVVDGLGVGLVAPSADGVEVLECEPERVDAVVADGAGGVGAVLLQPLAEREVGGDGNGVVELTGKVTMPYKRDGIAERVAKVSGVTAVRNRITVLPVSQFDDDLRVRIARAIYSNPNFRGYGSRVNPPIHVIVERGRVTLEGVVNNNTDRVIAQSIASSFGAFKITSELKTIDEAKRELERL